MVRIYKQLKEEVCRANKQIAILDLALFTWGNVSAVDRIRNVMAIKPSGVPYDKLKPEHIVVVDLKGNVVEGKLRPSSDTPTHIVLYKHFSAAKAIVHTHSTNATIFAQAKKPIVCLGTTHADHFYGEIPVTRDMSDNEIHTNYEENTGHVIVELFEKNKLDPAMMMGCLVASHGPFVWGDSLESAVYNAAVLEEVARSYMQMMSMNAPIKKINKALLDKHFLRKHGKDAYYGQKNYNQ